MASFKVGDKVKAVAGYFKQSSKFNGVVGTVTEVEECGGAFEYRVEFPNGGRLDDSFIEEENLEVAR